MQPTRTPPIAVTVAAVVVLVSAIAATGHTSVWGGARTGVADPLRLLAIVAIAFGLSAAGAAALSRLASRSGRTLGSMLPGVVVAAVLLSLAAISRVELRIPPPVTGVAAERPDGRLGVPLRSDWRGPATRRDREASAAVTDAESFGGVEAFRRLVLVAGVLAMILALVLRRRAAAVPPEELRRAADAAARAEAHRAVVGTIGAMLSDPDPRTAIIGAYARLQEELGRSHASRLDYEGPTEHLLRVLRVLDVRSDPLRRLIDLFELARFSDHALTIVHRDAALAALRDVAADLAPVGPAAVAVADPGAVA